MPWWQKYWLDVILLIPAGYGLWQLTQQSKQALSGSQGIPDPLQNPLLLLVPALGIFSVALFTLRLVPRFMAFISWALRPSKSVGFLMAARYLERTPAFYSAPLFAILADAEGGAHDIFTTRQRHRYGSSRGSSARLLSLPS